MLKDGLFIHDIPIEREKRKEKRNKYFILAFYGYFKNSQSDQLPDGLIAQLVENCTGIAEVIGSNRIPFRPEFLSGLNFATDSTAMINHVFIAYEFDMKTRELFFQK